MSYKCENCSYKKECKREYGTEYRAIIGTHMCRYSWTAGYYTSTKRVPNMEEKSRKLHSEEWWQKEKLLVEVYVPDVSIRKHVRCIRDID